MSGDKSATRRDFMTMLGVASAAIAIPPGLWGCVSEAAFEGRNLEWEQQAAQIEADGLYTQNDPGPWSGKEAVHIPDIALNEGEGSATVTVNHVMTEEHFIPLIYIRNQLGFIIGFREFDADAGAAEATFRIPAGTTEITAFGFCNLHNNWKNDPANV